MEEADTRKIIAEMYQSGVNMGANAIIRFNIVPHRLDNNGTEISTVRATGFAIRRIP